MLVVLVVESIGVMVVVVGVVAGIFVMVVVVMVVAVVVVVVVAVVAFAMVAMKTVQSMPCKQEQGQTNWIKADYSKQSNYDCYQKLN